MLSVLLQMVVYADYQYAECCYADCRYADGHYAECHYAQCDNAQGDYGKFYSCQMSHFYCNAQCQYTECPS